MKKISRRNFSKGLAAAALSTLARPALGQGDYPAGVGTIKLVVPYPAGGATDVIGRIVAASDHDHMRVVRRGANLVRVFAGIKRIRLTHLFAESAVAVDPMHGERARVVIGGQQKLARQIDAGVNGA